MALIPPFFLDCVVSIGVVVNSNVNWIGTGFIAGRPLPTSGEDEKQYHTFVVTNKHVLEASQNIILRFNPLEGEQPLDYPIDLAPNNSPIWVSHSADDVDIATFYINPDILKRDKAEFHFFRMDIDSFSVADLKEKGASEGDGIFVLGFPMGIVAPQRKHVISRKGAIARIRDVLDNQQTSFLIDAFVFPGNSGGPVVIRPEVIAIEGTKTINNAALIGIVKSYVPYKDIAISQQTGNPRVIFEENSGLALVDTVDNILSVIEDCYEKKIKKDP